MSQNYAWNGPKCDYPMLCDTDERFSLMMIKQKGSDVTCHMELRGKGLPAYSGYQPLINKQSQNQSLPGATMSKLE